MLGAASPAIQCRQIVQQNLEFVKFHKVPCSIKSSIKFRNFSSIAKFVQLVRNNYGFQDKLWTKYHVSRYIPYASLSFQNQTWVSRYCTSGSIIHTIEMYHNKHWLRVCYCYCFVDPCRLLLVVIADRALFVTNNRTDQWPSGNRLQPVQKCLMTRFTGFECTVMLSCCNSLQELRVGFWVVWDSEFRSYCSGFLLLMIFTLTIFISPLISILRNKSKGMALM